MAKNSKRFPRKILALLLTLILTISLISVTAAATELTITDKIEIVGVRQFSIAGYNALVIKQSGGCIIWLRDADDMNDQDVLDAIQAADPSIKGNYVVVGGPGPFYFSDFFSGNQYKNTSFSISGDVVTIEGDYSHASPFAYTKGEPEPTEPEPTEPEPTEPEPTEPEPTEPEPTEPEPTEPEPTEPEPTEPEPTEPEPTEPEPTEPEPTEPEPTEPEPTEPEPTEPEPTEPDPTEPDPIQPDPTEPDDNDQPDITSDSYLIIPDEDVPLADVPVTGDMAILWAAISLFSGGGLILLNKKRKED